MESWVIFAIIAGLASNGFNFFSRYFLRDHQDATAWSWFFEIGRTLIFLVFALFDWRLEGSIQTISLLMILGLAEVLAIYTTMKMHQHAHLSISTILSRTRVIWIPIFAFIIYHEHLLISQYLGIIVLFLGLSIVISPRKLFIDKGAVYANVAAITIAFHTVLLKAVAPHASIPVITVAVGLPSIFLFPLIMKNPIKQLKEFSQKNLWLKLLTVGIQVVSTFFFMFALQKGEVSRVNAIYQGMMIVSVVAGVILLRERKDIVKKLIGALITIFGVLLIG